MRISDLSADVFASVLGCKCALQVIGKSMPNHPLGAADISIAGWVESQVLNPARGLRGHYETSDFCRAACQRDPADCNGRQGRAAVRESLPLDGLGDRPLLELLRYRQSLGQFHPGSGLKDRKS